MEDVPSSLAVLACLRGKGSKSRSSTRRTNYVRHCYLSTHKDEGSWK